jgi:hypothetical protein
MSSRRAFITLLGGAAAGGRSRRAALALEPLDRGSCCCSRSFRDSQRLPLLPAVLERELLGQHHVTAG